LADRSVPLPLSARFFNSPTTTTTTQKEKKKSSSLSKTEAERRENPSSEIHKILQ
jgi:hypothetical protein